MSRSTFNPPNDVPTNSMATCANHFCCTILWKDEGGILSAKSALAVCTALTAAQTYNTIRYVLEVAVCDTWVSLI